MSPLASVTSGSRVTLSGLAQLLPRWPLEASRPGRSLREHWSQRCRRESDAWLQNPTRIRHMRNLVENRYAKQYPIAETFDPIQRNAYALLSSQMQKDQYTIRPSGLFFPLLKAWWDYWFVPAHAKTTPTKPTKKTRQ